MSPCIMRKVSPFWGWWCGEGRSVLGICEIFADLLSVSSYLLEALARLFQCPGICCLMIWTAPQREATIIANHAFTHIKSGMNARDTKPGEGVGSNWWNFVYAQIVTELPAGHGFSLASSSRT